MIKKIKSFIYRIYIKFKEKHIMINDRDLKYLFINNKGEDLIICFSGFPAQNDVAKYNYIKTLKKVKKKQLYILDDFGYQKKGSYYLGEYGNYFLETEIPKLISKIKQKYNIKKIYTVGTSKGGWASIYYGILIKANVIICGAPQYHIGDYLNTTNYHKCLLSGIIGNKENEKEIKILNNKLSLLIQKSDLSKIKFIIHYSVNEHTYKEHIIYLLKDLKEKNAIVIENIGEYSNHNDVGKFFQQNLLKILNEER